MIFSGRSLPPQAPASPCPRGAFAQTPARQTLGAPRAPDGKPLRAGLIGCGGRGRGAMINFLDAGPNLQLVALADVFPDRIAAAREELKKDKGIEIADNRCYTGFDAFEKLIDSDVDIVLNCTPPHFRPAHFAACVEAGKHCFLEKPVGVDPVGVRSVLATSEKATSKGLAVMTGTQLRRELPRLEVRNRVLDGMIGDIRSVRAFRNQGALWYRPREANWSDMEYMIRDWVNWNWLSGDHIVEQHIHHLDAMLWVMGKPPVKAVGMGARMRRPQGDQYDFFSIDYTFDDGVHMHSTIRQIGGARTCATKRWIDLVPELLAAARESAPPNARFVEGDAARCRSRAAFDLVCTRRTLHHVGRPELAVAELARVCKFGGRVFVDDQIAPPDPLATLELDRFERREIPRTIGRSPTATCETSSMNGLRLLRRAPSPIATLDYYLGLAGCTGEEAERVKDLSPGDREHYVGESAWYLCAKE